MQRYDVFLTLIRGFWYPALPVVLVYFWLRGRKDRRYRCHWGERFGGGPTLPGAIWVHAVSLGEMRSAVPLVRALLDRGDRVITTHLTPAGRRASETAFAAEIADGRLVARYLPLEFGWAYRRFLRVRPRLALIMEIEVWPVMIAEARRASVPLFLANSQYPARSFTRDLRIAGWLGHPLQQVSGVLAKSETHAARFRALGAPNVLVCGELRFDQPIAAPLLSRALALRQALGSRLIVTLASVVEGEDALYVQVCSGLKAALAARGLAPPLFIYVPRAPERFAPVAAFLAASGLQTCRRSALLDAALAGDLAPVSRADILLGDSLGEMYFYLAPADLVIVGGGFLPSGAHNIIEPLALRKPVLVGPNVWSIEYPGVEAVAAQVVKICQTPQTMIDAALRSLTDRLPDEARPVQEREAFFLAYSGATARILAAVDLTVQRPLSA